MTTPVSKKLLVSKSTFIDAFVHVRHVRYTDGDECYEYVVMWMQDHVVRRKSEAGYPTLLDAKFDAIVHVATRILEESLI